MRIQIRWVLSFVGVIGISPAVYAQSHPSPPWFPGTVTLIGWPDPRDGFYLSTEKKSEVLQGYDREGGLARLSRDGSLVITDCSNGNPPPDHKNHIALFSVEKKVWREFDGGCRCTSIWPCGCVALSSDNQWIAYVVHTGSIKQPGENRLHLLNLNSGADTPRPELGPWSIWNLDWSPDSQKIAFERTTEEYWNGTIETVNLRSGAIAKLAEGHSPAWSPSGDWIAYFDSDEKHVSLMHPDGSEKKNVARMKNNSVWDVPMLWSADCKQILINQWLDGDNGSFSVYLLDVATMKTKRAFKNVSPVWGWAPAK